VIGPACAIAILLALAVAAALPVGAPAASSSTVVSAYVPSATTLDTSSCDDPATPGMLSFGVVVPGSAVRSAACQVTWGSSNDNARLLMRQSDGAGVAMSAYGAGALDLGLTGGTGRGSWNNANDQHVFRAIRQSDGKVLVAGTTGPGELWNDMYLARWDPATNALDPTWDGPSGTGDGQFTMTASFNTNGLELQGTSVIVVGVTHPSLGTEVRRLTATGATDTTFGTAGVATVQVDGSAESEQVNGVSVAPNGKVYVFGCVRTGPACNGTGPAYLVRLTVDGAPDPTFGGGDGIETYAAYRELWCAEELPDGRIATCGALDGGASFVGMATAAGAVDTSFSAPDGHDALGGTLGDMVVGQDGDLYVAWHGPRISRYAVSNGQVVTSWGTAGTVTFPGGLNAWQLAQLGDGSWAIGSSTQGLWPGDNPVVSRATHAGAIDTTFGTAGSATYDYVIAGRKEFLGGLVDLGDGRMGVFGSSNPTGTDLQPFVYVLDDRGTVAQYGGGNNWASAASTSMFGVCLSTSTNSTATWSASAGCPTSDGAWWRAVPTTADQVATESAAVDSVSTFHFAFRPSSGQAPGVYGAPITFEVVAP
jgi:uncharacterized delta-60 repeat protein